MAENKVGSIPQFDESGVSKEDIAKKKELINQDNQAKEEKPEEGSPEIKSEEPEKEAELSEETHPEEEELTPEQLAEVKQKAKQYDDLLPDYTRKSQRLAQFEKREVEPEIKAEKPVSKKSEPNISDKIKSIAEKKGWKEDEVRSMVDIVNEIMPEMGYARREEISKQTYDQIQQQQVDDFVEKHPEFKKENDANDEKWNALMTEFNTYVRPAKPSQIGKFLEKARTYVFGTKPADSEAKVLAKIKKDKTASVGSGGGGKSSTTPAKKQIKEKTLKTLQEHSDFSPEEIKRMAGN